MDKITIIATVLSILSIFFAIVTLYFTPGSPVVIKHEFKHFAIEFKDGSKIDVKNSLDNFGEAEKLIDALYDAHETER